MSLLDKLPYLPEAQQQQILKGPARYPPKGIKANFENPPNNNELAMVIASITTVVAVLVVFMRAWARIVCIKTVHVEDFLVLIALACMMGHTYIISFLLKNPGYYVHQWDIKLEQLGPHIWGVYIGSSLYVGSVLASKLAILIEWIRIFVPKGQRNVFYWLCVALIVANTLLYGIGLIIQNVQCDPIEALWDFTVAGQCIWIPQYMISTAALNVVSDIAILVLPQKVVWSLKMSAARKIAISIVFAVGLLTCVIAIVRVDAVVNYLASDDVTYDLSPLSLIIQVEMCCLLLVACIPSAPKVFRESAMLSKIRSMADSLKTLMGRTRTGSSRHTTGDAAKVASSLPYSHKDVDMAIPARSPYHQMDDLSGSFASQNNMVATTSSPMRSVASMESRRSERGGGILRTTEFVAHEDYTTPSSLSSSPGAGGFATTTVPLAVHPGIREKRQG